MSGPPRLVAVRDGVAPLVRRGPRAVGAAATAARCTTGRCAGWRCVVRSGGGLLWVVWVGLSSASRAAWALAMHPASRRAVFPPPFSLRVREEVLVRRQYLGAGAFAFGAQRGVFAWLSESAPRGLCCAQQGLVGAVTVCGPHWPLAS
jgi:hypothetical protein